MVMLWPIQLKTLKLELVKNKANFFLGLLSFICYGFLGYFVNRNEFITLLSTIALLFICYVYFIKYKNSNVNNLFHLGLFFRLILLGTTPFLSQDFYRFIWDGRLILKGISPYEFTPIALIDSIKLIQGRTLFNGMGSLSANHFSNYPPINQLLFATAGLFSSHSIIGSIIIFRIQIIIADIGIYVIGKRILRQLSINENTIFFYFLNPLVLIELTGNLHFEGVMICFFLFGIYFLIKNKLLVSALFISLSIGTKLLPLLLLPILLHYLKCKKSIPFYALIVLLTIVMFLPFTSTHLINNYRSTISLWFTSFEFNASIYYCIRAIGFYFYGYNIIATLGKITPIILLFFILYSTFFRKNNTPKALFVSFLLVLTVYFFQSTTVHPWYIINLVILTCFTKFKFPLVWSFTVFLSYFAYSNLLFKENMLLISIEYLLVFSILFYEIKYKKEPKQIV